jgi:hypothetical protein
MEDVLVYSMLVRFKLMRVRFKLHNLLVFEDFFTLFQHLLISQVLSSQILDCGSLDEKTFLETNT